MNPDILNVFGVNNLNLVIDDVKKLLGVDEVGLPMDTVTAVATIIEVHLIIIYTNISTVLTFLF
jgi:hypothetical protein